MKRFDCWLWKWQFDGDFWSISSNQRPLSATVLLAVLVRRAAQPVDAIEARLPVSSQSTCPWNLSVASPPPNGRAGGVAPVVCVLFHGKLLSTKESQNVRPQRMFLMYKTSNCGACIAQSRHRTQHAWLEIRLRTKHTSNQPKICTHSKVVPVYAQSTFAKWTVN